MKQLLSISVTTKTWTEGNHAWFDARIKPGAIIEVHWGDRSHSIFPHSRDWTRVDHYYTGHERKEESFEIEFLSEDEDALIALVDGTWEMTVDNVRIKNCPALTSLQYCQAQHLDLAGCPDLETLDAHEYYGQCFDIAPLRKLRHLSLKSSPFIRSLSLTKNPTVEILNIWGCEALTKVSISNYSRLRILSTEFTQLDRHSLKWLEKTVKANGGEITEWIDVAFSSYGVLIPKKAR